MGGLLLRQAILRCSAPRFYLKLPAYGASAGSIRSRSSSSASPRRTSKTPSSLIDGEVKDAGIVQEVRGGPVRRGYHLRCVQTAFCHPPLRRVVDPFAEPTEESIRKYKAHYIVDDRVQYGMMLVAEGPCT